MKLKYVVQSLRQIADLLEDDKNLESGDLEGCVEQLAHISKLIKNAMQYVGERS